MLLLDLFWNASLEELKSGYVEEDELFICLLCGKQIEKGIIYPEDGVLYEAERFTRIHIQKVHESVFAYLMKLDKKLTGLSEHQNRLLQLFYDGASDAEVQKAMGIGSASTIRNHRFVLKEKERQSKVYLALMELSKSKDRHAPTFVEFHKTAKMIDQRYNVTTEENDKVLRKYFPQGVEGALSAFPVKEKNKLVILREIAKRFQQGHMYHEKDINVILKEIYSDYVTLRRYLIEYGFLDRKPDGSQYWVKEL
jgi:hypothetical protein